MLSVFVGLIGLGRLESQSLASTGASRDGSVCTTHIVIVISGQTCNVEQNSPARARYPGGARCYVAGSVGVDSKRSSGFGAFPGARTLAAGMSGAEILANFGEPSARVTRPQQGEVSE